MTQQVAINSNEIVAMWETEKKGDAGWWEYSYDPNGNLTHQIAIEQTEAITPNRTTQYIWDKLISKIRIGVTFSDL